MTLIEKFKQYPAVLWALALYLCSLGFNLKYDVPLAIFAMVSVYAFSNLDHHASLPQILKKYGVMLGFLLVTLIVTLASRNIGHSLTVQIQWLPGLLIYFALIIYADQSRNRDFVVVSVVSAALVAQMAFMAQALYLSDVPGRLEKMWAIESPLLVAPNDVLFFSIWTPLAAYLLLGKNTTLKILGIVYMGVTIIVSMYMQSRQSVGICLVSLCVLVFLWRPKAGTWVLVGGVFWCSPSIGSRARACWGSCYIYSPGAMCGTPPGRCSWTSLGLATVRVCSGCSMRNIWPRRVTASLT